MLGSMLQISTRTQDVIADILLLACAIYSSQVMGTFVFPVSDTDRVSSGLRQWKPSLCFDQPACGCVQSWIGSNISWSIADTRSGRPLRTDISHAGASIRSPNRCDAAAGSESLWMLHADEHPR